MLLCFAGYTIDPSRREIRLRDEVVHVEPQVFDLLLYLIENRDRVVGRDELFAAIWQGRIVSEATLSSRISAARRAIGDAGEKQAFIRTVPRRGFLFRGDQVSFAGEAATPARLGAPGEEKEQQLGIARRAYADIIAGAADDAAMQKAAALLADVERAGRNGDDAGTSRIVAELQSLGEELAREYTFTIVSRPGVPTGVWRRPPTNSVARNYYLMVEAITPDGRKLSLPIRNEENGITETVAIFGVRVSREVFEAVAQDHFEDGIVGRNQFGVKRRGTLAIEYQMPFEGGCITEW